MQFKGQTATEYLVILAVVIILALVTIGTLGGMPSLAGGTGNKLSAVYWSSSADVGINSYSVSATQNATFAFDNNLRNPVTINSVKLRSGNNPDTTVFSGSLNLGTGKTSTVSYNLTSATADPNRCVNAGDAYSYIVTLTYTNQLTSASYTITNQDSNPLKGVCAN